MSDFTPTVDTVGDAALTNSILDRSITELRDNNVTKIGSNAFNYCSALTTVVFGNVTEVGSNAFVNCSSLRIADFHASVYLPSSIFRGCHKLEALVLRGAMNEAVISTFASSAIEAGNGYIYVPTAQVDSYKAHAHWSTFADQFRNLEEWTVDGTTTGELDI